MGHIPRPYSLQIPPKSQSISSGNSRGVFWTKGQLAGPACIWPSLTIYLAQPVLVFYLFVIVILNPHPPDRLPRGRLKCDADIIADLIRWLGSSATYAGHDSWRSLISSGWCVVGGWVGWWGRMALRARRPAKEGMEHNL